MRRLNNLTLAALVGALALAVPMVPTYAQDAEAPSQAPTLGLIAAIERAEADLGGRVLEAELETEDGVTAYEIEIVVDGERREVVLDAASGEVLETKGAGPLSRVTGWFEGKDTTDGTAFPRPLSELLTEVEAATSGEVREVELETDGPAPVYEIELVTAEGVREVLLDPATGEMRPGAADD